MMMLKLILIMILITFSKSYTQDYWLKTNGLDSVTIYSLAIHSNGNIFAGTNGNGIFRSTDNGENWANLGILNYDIRTIAIGPTGDVLAGTIEWGGIFRSTDSGNSWTNIGAYHFDRVIAINPGGDIFLGTAALGVYRSTDNGANWVQVLQDSTGKNVNSLIINSNGDIFAGTIFGGVFRSTDNGDNWIQISQGLTFNNVYCLAIDSSGNIFAGTIAGGVFLSTDNGENWVQKSQGLTSEGFYVYSLMVNSSGNVIFAGTNDGIFISTDSGENWIQNNQGLLTNNVQSLAINSVDDIFAGTDQGIFRHLHGTTSVNTTDPEIISSFQLYQNYPNPFNPSTVISYQIPVNSNVVVKVYDILGNEAATLVDEYKPAGKYEVNFTATRLASGVYIFRLAADNYAETRKMMLLR